MNGKQHADRFLEFVARDPATRDMDLLFQAAVVENLCNLNENLDRICQVLEDQDMRQARLNK